MFGTILYSPAILSIETGSEIWAPKSKPKAPSELQTEGISKKTAKISLQVNNLLNNEYVNNAWVYRFISDGWDPRDSDHYVNKDSERGYNMAAYFPEATRNYLLGLTLGF